MFRPPDSRVIRCCQVGSGEEIVPSREEIEAMEQASNVLAQQQGLPGHGGLGENAADAQGDQPSPLSQDMGPRTNIAGGVG